MIDLPCWWRGQDSQSLTHVLGVRISHLLLAAAMRSFHIDAIVSTSSAVNFAFFVLDSDSESLLQHPLRAMIKNIYQKKLTHQISVYQLWTNDPSHSWHIMIVYETQISNNHLTSVCEKERAAVESVCLGWDVIHGQHRPLSKLPFLNCKKSCSGPNWHKIDKLLTLIRGAYSWIPCEENHESSPSNPMGKTLSPGVALLLPWGRRWQ